MWKLVSVLGWPLVFSLFVFTISLKLVLVSWIMISHALQGNLEMAHWPDLKVSQILTGQVKIVACRCGAASSINITPIVQLDWDGIFIPGHVIRWDNWQFFGFILLQNDFHTTHFPHTLCYNCPITQIMINYLSLSPGLFLIFFSTIHCL